MAVSMFGAPSACTDAGPPEKITPFGLRRAISSAEMSWGTISEWTWASRTRRAMSWAYWAPKSTTRTVSNSRSDLGSDVGDTHRAPPGMTISSAFWNSLSDS